MNDPKLSEVIEAKFKMEQEIRNAIRKFNLKTDLPVDYIEVTQSYEQFDRSQVKINTQIYL